MNQKPSFFKNGLGLVSFFGFFISLYQSSRFYALKSGFSGFDAFCTPGKQFNCEAVESSAYAELIFGIPLSSFAAGWFLSIFFLVWMSKKEEWKNACAKVLWGMSLWSVLMSIIYLSIMLFKIKLLCVYCLVVDGINLVSLFFAWKIFQESKTKSPINMDQLRTTGGVVAGTLGAVVILTSIFMSPESVPSSEMRTILHTIMQRPVHTVSTDSWVPSTGAKDAKVVIVKFSDFECPACKIAAFQMYPLKLKYKNQVRFEYRNFPLDPTCNPEIKHSLHKNACEAAKAGICINEQGKFEEYYQKAFSQQDELSPSSIREWSKEFGLDMDKFETCMQNPETLSSIQKDIEEAMRVKVEGTPTFFINGKKVESYPTQIWEKIIEAHLSSP